MANARLTPAHNPNFDALGDEIRYPAPMTSFYCDGEPISHPADIIPFLAAQEKHWRKGRSAWELAHSWMGSGSFPAAVAAMLTTHRELKGARLVEGLNCPGFPGGCFV